MVEDGRKRKSAFAVMKEAKQRASAESGNELTNDASPNSQRSQNEGRRTTKNKKVAPEVVPNTAHDNFDVEMSPPSRQYLGSMLKRGDSKAKRVDPVKKSKKSKKATSADLTLQLEAAEFEIRTESSLNSDDEIAAPETKKSKKSKQKRNKLQADANQFEIDEPGVFAIGHSVQSATRLFERMIAPVDFEQFKKVYWEKRVLYCPRAGNAYYQGLFSVKQFERILDEHYLEFGTNVNMARYVHDQRETLNPTGRAYAAVVRDLYSNADCSVQFINPQSYDNNVWKLCARLQELFCSFVGANSYWTPAGTQGFAPHWDDVDAFVLQLEGRKLWRVYKPQDDDVTLPRESSDNFRQEEVDHDCMVFEQWLEPGDMLYMPRGFIHQALSHDDEHSLHLTVSVSRKNSYADMFEKLLPDALEAAIKEHSMMRQSLPIGYMQTLGCCVPNESQNTTESLQDHFCANVEQMVAHVSNQVMDNVDAGADMMAKEFIRQALPPYLTELEKSMSIAACANERELTLNDRIKFLRMHGQRLIYETEESAALEHRMHNSRVFEERPPSSLDIPTELIEGVRYLIEQYPSFVSIQSLPCDTDDLKMQLATMLWNHGLIMRQEI